jgi:hypothetical protein
MHGSSLSRLSIVVCGWVFVGCGAAGPTGPDAPPSISTSSSVTTLTQALRDGGATVTPTRVMPRDSFPFFAVAAQGFMVNGETIHVFEYSSAANASTDQAKVAESGTPVGPVQITWIEPPRFYRYDRIIVLYVGHSDDVARRLELILGRPFAGTRT